MKKSTTLAIEYKRATVTLPPDPDNKDYPYDLVLHTYAMTLAGDTGLAYIEEQINNTPAYTVVHVPSGRFLNTDWCAATERLARMWIEWSVKLTDWTGVTPRPRKEYFFELFALASAGMLVDPDLDPAGINDAVLPSLVEVAELSS